MPAARTEVTMHRLSTCARARGRTAALLFLLVAFATAPVAAASQSGTNRPFRGSLDGQIVFLFDWDEQLCPVTTVTDATGWTTHLGAVSSHWSHCPPVVQPGYTDGHVAFTAANGDTVFGAYEDADGDVPFIVEIVGGTGRFAGAHGSFTLWFEADGPWGDDGMPISPWTWSGTFDGVISY
jgi:hypothetical protein